MALTIQTITTISQLKLLWDKQPNLPQPTVFNSPQWLLTWLTHYWQPQWQLCSYAIYQHEKLVAFAPFYIQTAQHWFDISILYPLGQGEPEQSEVASEYTDIFIFSRYEKEVMTLLRNKLNNLAIDQIIWRANLQNSYINKLLSTYDVGIKPSGLTRFIITTNNWTVSQISKNNRSRYKRSINQLKKINAHFEWVCPENYQEYFNKLALYHQNRWQEKNKAGAFSTQKFCDFHQALLQDNAARNVKMSAVVINGTPIAINYYLLDDNTLYFYQSGWDIINYAKLSIGMALHLWSIENNPLDYYDFMMGSTHDSYKSKFNTTTSPMNNIDYQLQPWKIKLHRLLSKLTKSSH